MNAKKKISTIFSSLSGLSLVLLVAVGFASCKIVEPEQIQRPSGVKPYSKLSQNKLAEEGKKLWSDKSLSAANNVACATCHKNFQGFNESFKKPYPHYVEMPGVKLEAESMVQFCMLKPMGRDKVLPWDSRELAALTAYTLEVQTQYIKANNKK